MDKQLIQSRFSGAMESYDQSAVAQRQIAKIMLQLIQDKIGNKVGTLLEVGCGTGIFSRMLTQNLEFKKIFLNDICAEMETKIAEILTPHDRFLCGDAESISFPSSLDLITSSSTIQWFTNLDSFFAKCSISLQQGGFVAFATFGEENMKEVRALTHATLKYYSKEELKNKLRSSGFEIIHSETDFIDILFESPLHVLHHLKQTGVTGLKKFRWTKEKLQRFTDDYRFRFGKGNGVSLRYHPLFIIAKKSLT